MQTCIEYYLSAYELVLDRFNLPPELRSEALFRNLEGRHPEEHLLSSCPTPFAPYDRVD